MSDSKHFHLNVDGEKLAAIQGQTIAEVLLANGKITFRKTQKHVPRGAFCGMGVCYECRMKIDGIPNVRACITPASPGSIVETQLDGQIDSLRSTP